MRSKLKKILTVGAAALAFYTANPIKAEVVDKNQEEYNLIKEFYDLQEQKETLEQKILESKKELNEKKIPSSYFEPYGTNLTFEDYSKITRITQENNIKGSNYKKFVRLERVLEHEDFMDKVAEHYGINKQEIIRLWNQETAFDIDSLGPHGERGLAQFRGYVANLLFKSIAKPGDELYFDWENFYPEFDVKNYNFEQLSKDYKLNIIMTAAQEKLTPDIFEHNLRNTGLTSNQLLNIVRNKGIKTNFSKLKDAIRNPNNYNLNEELKKTIRNYSITTSRIRDINRIYLEDEAILKSALKYIVHNGGGGAVKNITTDSFISELLIYHLALYVKNLESLYQFMNYHYEGLENMVGSHKNYIENLQVGESFDIWGHEVKNIDIPKFEKYFQHGLSSVDYPIFFNQGKGKIINNYLIKEDFSLEALDNNLAKMFKVDDIDELYEKLVMFKDLEKNQLALNRAWSAKDQKGMKFYGGKVTSLEREINKKFNMDRKHTGISGIKADIIELEKEIRDASFIIDLKKYSEMKQKL